MRSARQTYLQRRAAFTLVEMVVAVALLMLLMAMAGTVFKVTLEGTGRLTQLSEVDRSIRLFKNNLARELAAINPRSSVLAIQGNVAPAYWTEEDQAADINDQGTPDPINGIGRTVVTDPLRSNPTIGYDPLDRGGQSGLGTDTSVFDPFAGDNAEPQLPRADILMFVTNLPDARSFVDPTSTSDGPLMVVYNHADLWNGADWERIPSLVYNNGEIQRSNYRLEQLVAREWHLARRAVLMRSYASTTAETALSPTNRNDSLLTAGQYAANRDDPLECGTLPNGSRVSDCRSMTRLLRGQNDIVGRAPLPDPPTTLPPYSFDFDREIANRVFEDVGPVPAAWLARSLLDPNPPARESESLGHFFLPYCASFKVEWTPNDIRLDQARMPEVLWIDPFKEPGGTRANGPDYDVADDAALTGVAPVVRPVHLDEFNIMAQRMRSDPDAELGVHELFGLAGTLVDPTDPQPRGSNLYQAYTRLLPRFGLSQGTVAGGQLNVFDIVPQSSGVVQPSWNTHTWYARDFQLDSFGGRTLDSPDPLWPKALRITIDLYDDAGSFETPIRHVFVLPIGSQGDLKQKIG